MIVGVGIFGIPYAVAQSGFMTGLFYLILLTGVVLFIHLFYGEVVLRTDGEHRLVGYAKRYLGERGKRAAGAIVIFQFYGALLAYIIAGGYFLAIIFNNFGGGSEFFWSLAFFVFGSLAVLFGLRTVGFLELLMTTFLLLIAGIIVFKAAPLINFNNLSGFSFSNLFLPYGIILFSLSGGAAIPEIRQMLKGQERKLKKIIVWGTIIPAIIYLLFTLAVVGITGVNTSKEAISGLAPYFGKGIIVLGAVFGFLAVATSFLVLGLNLKRVFQCDYKLNRTLAWFLACFVPLFFYLLGFQDFITVIGLVGALAGGLEGIMVILIYRKAKILAQRRPEYSLKTAGPIIYGMILLFELGIFYHFLYFFK